MLQFHLGSNIIEVGCGSGYLLPYMVCKKHPEAKLVAVDLSQEMLTRASLRLDRFLHCKTGLLDDIKLDQNSLIESANFDEINTKLMLGNAESLP
jgi:cyclopropane fatty-acyl-phospholipid synthase-like methyltransferase